MNIGMNQLPVSEAEIKRAVEDRLIIAQQQGLLLFLRLNSGDFIETRGTTRRRVKGCPPGTADFVMFQAGIIQAAYQATIKSPPIPVCFTTFLEIKSSIGKQSSEQKAFEEEVKKLHARYVIIRDTDELEELL